MISLRKAIQIAIYGSVLAAGGTSASVQILANPGAEDPWSDCNTNPDVWTESNGAQRSRYSGTCAGAPSWVDTTPPFEGEDWMFRTGNSNNATETQMVTGIPAPIRPASEPPSGGLCIESVFPDLDSSFWVSGWFSTKCQDGVEGTPAFRCQISPSTPEDYGQIQVRTGNASPHVACQATNLQSYRPARSSAWWEEIPADACKDGLEGGNAPHKYEISLRGHDGNDDNSAADVVWDNIGLNIQCTRAVAAMGGRSFDTPAKDKGKQKPVRTYGGRMWSEWEGPDAPDFVLMGSYTITYHKTPGGGALRDTCHLEADWDTEMSVQPSGLATIAGLRMWCNQSGCEDDDVDLTINEVPAPRGSVALASSSCTDDHNFAPKDGALDAGNVVVEGLMDTD